MSNQLGIVQTLKEEPNQSNVLEKRTTMKLQIEPSQVYTKLKEMIKSNELKFAKDMNYSFIGDTIKLVGSAQSVLLSEQMIINAVQQLKSQLISKPLELSQKEVSFYIKKIQHTKQDKYCKTFGCQIEVIEDQVSSRNLIASTLSYQGRELNVAYADISKFPCDAIVNSCNNQMSFGNVDLSTGVSNTIFDMAGPEYAKFCDSYIQKHQILEFGKVISYPITNSKGVLKYIINVSTPIYQNGEQANQDYLKIEQNIKAIFVEANKLNVKTLAFPIFGGGTCGYSFKSITQNVLNYTINALYSHENQAVQKVYITELTEQKLKQICEIMKTIIEIPKLQRSQVQYQWQWNSGCEFYDYDDEDVNKQIDEGYEQFLYQKSPLEIQLQFPFTKQPGTHWVDLNSMIIYDYERNINKPLSLQTDLGYDKFLLDNKDIDEALNEYLVIQNLNNNMSFEIFNKQHKIVFNSDGTIVQINQETGTSREIKKIPYQKNQQQATQNYFIGRDVKLEQAIDDILMNYKTQQRVFVKSFDPKVNQELQSIIKQEIFKNIVDFRFTLPLMKQADFNELKRIIIKNSIKFNGEIENGKSQTVQILKDKQYKFQALLDQILANTKKYPKYWVQQDKNFIKVNIPSNSEEYKKIEFEFLKTYQGKILQIYRLQNQKLWENYQSEVQKFLELKLKNKIQLTQLEQERYLWHGVRGQHPKIIYESIKEAFDITYSNRGSWGYGAYFAEQASYSKGFSHTLKQQEDPTHAGKLVFLYCKVTTGRLDKKNSNSSIRKPSEGYDCVTNGTGILFYMEWIQEEHIQNMKQYINERISQILIFVLYSNKYIPNQSKNIFSQWHLLLELTSTFKQYLTFLFLFNGRIQFQWKCYLLTKHHIY